MHWCLIFMGEVARSVATATAAASAAAAAATTGDRITSTIITLIVVLLPVVHFVSFSIIWPKEPLVDKATCDCKCWDGGFKGNHDRGREYKEVYFNLTSGAAAICIWSIMLVLLLHGTLQQLRKLCNKGRLDVKFALLTLLTLYPNYYGWWVVVNYINDNSPQLLRDQLFYSITELLQTSMLLSAADRAKRADTNPRLLLSIAGISLAHLFFSCYQRRYLLWQVLHGENATEFPLLLRDLGLVLPDMVTLAVTLRMATAVSTKNGRTATKENWRWFLGVFAVTFVLYFAISGGDIMD